MPAIGMIISKLSATECLVQITGIAKNFYVGLWPGKPLFANTAARPSNTFEHPVTGLRYRQVLGVATTSTDLKLVCAMPTGILPL
jgi:hypothetical protein